MATLLFVIEVSVDGRANRGEKQEIDKGETREQVEEVGKESVVVKREGHIY